MEKGRPDRPRAQRQLLGEKAKIKTLIFRVIPDNAARFLELQAGTIDIMDGLNPEDVPNVKNNPDLQLILRPSMNVAIWP
nr:ABC transporter substrate-binding protein [Calditerricola satsumensis]